MMKVFLVLLIGYACVSCVDCPDPGPMKRKMVGLLEKFDRWDYNGSGSLELHELDAAEKLSGYPKAEILSFYDSNQDDEISRVEAQVALDRVGAAKKLAKNIE